MVKATIDPYNSKKSTGHPESDNEAFDEKAKKEKLGPLVLDRNGYPYHGRVKVFAEAARENGLEF